MSQNLHTTAAYGRFSFGRTGMKKQRGWVGLDLGAAFAACVIVGAIVGGATFALLFYSLPWLWQQVKPWLHAITA